MARWLWILPDKEFNHTVAHTKPSVDGVQDAANRIARKAAFNLVAHRDQGYMRIRTIHRGTTWLDSYVLLEDPDPERGDRKGSVLGFEVGHHVKHSDGSRGKWVDGAGVLASAITSL
jgi:hypothetical protein